jgi:glycosyltransferase involved in cell wall biosynthesis
MRILHLIDSDGVYGAERILLYLAREQQRRGSTPLVGSIRPPGSPTTEFEQLAISWGLPVVPIRIRSALTPAVVRSLLCTIRHVRPHVLHSHGYKANILLGPLPRRVRGSMLTTLHGWSANRTMTALGLKERLDGWALRRIDAIVVVTRQMLELRALRKLSRDRIQVIENGIPPLRERLADMTAAGLAAVPAVLVEFMKRAPTFVAIGRLSPEKGFLLLLEAFATANTRNGGVHRLLIVGEGPERPKLERRIEDLGLRQNARLAGFVEGADRFLEHAAGFVMSSYTEGMPLVLLEAMQWESPILATEVGGIPEILHGCSRATLVPPRDIAAYTDAFGELMAPRSASAAIGRSFGTEGYSAVHMDEGYMRAYQRIV